jgi:hypothetical protein
MQLDNVFGNFDCPDAGQVAPKRNVSTTPLQALSLLNSAFLLEQSQYFAERLQHEAATIETQIDRAFRLAFGRAARPTELAAARQLVEQHGLPAFCRAMFNASEFLWVY